MRVHANGLSFNVNRHRIGPPGDRPVVVCVHGFAIVGGAASSFLLGFSLARDADVITYDLRGHGRTDVAPSGYRLADHAADLVALLDALGVTQPVHVVGFSYGGAVATVAALRYPERVASLSLLDGIVPIEGWEKAFYASIEHYEGVIALAKAQGMSMDAIIEACVRAVMEDQGVSHRRASSIGERIYRVFEQTTMKEDLRTEVAFAEAELRRIRCPVLGVYGSRSDLYPLTDRLPALVPDATVYTLPGAGHMEVYFRVEELRAIVRNFLGLPGALPPPDRAWRNV